MQTYSAHSTVHIPGHRWLRRCDKTCNKWYDCVRILRLAPFHLRAASSPLCLRLPRWSDHEKAVGALARDLGFTQVSLSSEVMPMVRAVPRGYTVCADAYLTPKIHQYLKGFTSGFEGGLKVRLRGTHRRVSLSRSQSCQSAFFTSPISDLHSGNNPSPFLFFCAVSRMSTSCSCSQTAA